MRAQAGLSLRLAGWRLSDDCACSADCWRAQNSAGITWLTAGGEKASVRRNMSLYRALAVVPGVDFMSNNHCVTRHYADWLKLEAKHFRVVYNGVLPPSTEPSSEVPHKIWQQFTQKHRMRTRLLVAFSAL